MDVGTLVLQTDPFGEGEQTWLLAEQVGVDVAYVSDPPCADTGLRRRWADPWLVLGAAADVTHSMRLGLLVAAASRRTAPELARAAAVVDEASAGRFVLGVGAGAPDPRSAEEADPGLLADRLDEVVHGLRALRYDSGATPLIPLPGRVRLVVAAHGPRGIRLAVEAADGWTTYGGPRVAGLDRDAFWRLVGRQSRTVSAECNRVGRDPETLTRSVLVGYAPHRTMPDPAAFLDDASRARDEGFGEIVFYWPTREAGDLLWAEPGAVAQAVREARRI